MAAGEEQSGSPAALPEPGTDATPDAPAGNDGERFGPLALERLRKGDGRALILYVFEPGPQP